jgi:hypothetical protein
VPPRPLDDKTFAHLFKAIDLWPYERRFREGPALRFKVWADEGK